VTIGISCLTQDAREQAFADPEFLTACTREATSIATSVFCTPECGGHPICGPCLQLALRNGMVATV